jgi:DNA repair protein RadC
MESDRIKSWPVNERPREKLLAEGSEKQTAADLLEIRQGWLDRWSPP